MRKEVAAVRWKRRWLQLHTKRAGWSYMRKEVAAVTCEKRWLQLHAKRGGCSYMRKEVAMAKAIAVVVADADNESRCFVGCPFMCMMIALVIVFSHLVDI